MPKYGNNLIMNVYGESHGEKVGVIINGLPIGTKIDLEALQKHVDRRKATNSLYSTSRTEPDLINIEQGIDANGVVTDKTVEISVKNTSFRKNDYTALQFKPRPSHADYPAMVKYGEKVSLSGGGKYSGRLTLPICIAGGICEQLLSDKGITVVSYLSEIGGIKGFSYKDRIPSLAELIKAKNDPFYFLNGVRGKIDNLLSDTKNDLDSVGGIIETVIYGLPVGLGDSLFDGLESSISSAIFAIPAVKGVEFGIGFDISSLKGSQANDCYYYDNDCVKLYSNNNGGLVGGMTNGAPITIRTAIKPTPSIGKEQSTVDLISKTNTTISIKGRHDVCIAPRATAPIESAVAFALLDNILRSQDE